MPTNRSAPPATVTPVLVYPDVRAAVEWLEGAFGFGERVRIGDDHRAQMRVGSDGSIVVADVHGEQVAPSAGAVTHLIKVRVEDVDAAFARARDFGARVLEEPHTWEYGERSVRRRGSRRAPLGADADGAGRRARGMGRRHRRAVVSTSSSQRRASSTSTRLFSSV